MPKSLLLNIPEPCHENWQNMTPQEQGRFCGSCQKVVVDFSVMTDKEVLEYFSKASQQVCGRFANDQLNKELTAPPTRKRITWVYVWNVLLASVLVTKSYAQGKPQVKKPPVIKTTFKGNLTMGEWVVNPVDAVIPVKMKGVVLDAQTNQPVSGASISIKSTLNGTSADTAGKFQLRVEKKNTLEVEVSAIGYEKQTLLLFKTANWENIQVSLKPAFDNLAKVTVSGYGLICRKSYTTGLVTIIKEAVIRDTINSDYIDKWKSTVLKNEVTIYPNPVMRGNAIQVKLSLPQEGEYRLELLSTTGQVMLIQPLFMQTKAQQIDLYTQTKWSAGIYYVRISSPKSKKVFEGKVMLQ
ncbi:hypothetical protein Niako_0414 [Niastella koreensis GR20-10]|uniref:Secretion system C-terminal sorting domain-containing protein n=2 Tax=Niastella koreensis TaxID=354356 RepID=G8TQS8_NIAKG|nr:T9SS type A sorting domain-containing protein [Niastella koreensis]AEV96812.1 hypothetical protein Niako_0414 [Niastella koreensis GR20-10]